MNKQEFLDIYIFDGMVNLNDGFDARGIKYFCEQDFRIILDRAEKHKICIYGIEPWKDGSYYDCEVAEFHTQDPSDPNWYKVVFEKFAKEDHSLQYAASYDVPEAIF